MEIRCPSCNKWFEEQENVGRRMTRESKEFKQAKKILDFCGSICCAIDIVSVMEGIGLELPILNGKECEELAATTPYPMPRIRSIFPW